MIQLSGLNLELRPSDTKTPNGNEQTSVQKKTFKVITVPLSSDGKISKM